VSQAETPHLGSPYLGLRSFEAGDAPYFFGRRREVELLAANLRTSRTTLVYGESGVGKSSLLRAGLGPTLAERSTRSREADHEGESFAAVICSVGREDPTPALAKAIRASLGTAQTAAPSIPLLELLGAAMRVVDRLLIVLDQFEQYLEYMGPSGEDRFAAEFVRVVSQVGLPVHFLIAIREDAISKFDRFGSAAREITANPIRIEPLSATAAREAITEPLRAFNETSGASYAAEKRFEDAIIAATRIGALDLGFGGRGGEQLGKGEEDEIEVAYLQLALQSTLDAERESDSDLLRLQTFEGLGGIPGIVRGHLDRIMGTLDPRSQRIAASAFRYLVTPSGMKVPYSAWDLGAMTEEDPEKIEAVLARLAEERARIVRPLGPSPRGDRRYEIYHDRLGDPILDWCARLTRGEDREQYARRLAAMTFAVFGATFAVLAVLGVQRLILVVLGGVAATYAFAATPLGARIMIRGLRPAWPGSMPIERSSGKVADNGRRGSR
jgi:hypothetical protein